MTTRLRAAAGSFHSSGPFPAGRLPMKLSSLRTLVALLCVGLLLAACSPQGSDQAAAPPTPAAAQDAAAAQQLDTYRQLLRIKNDEMAVTIGHAILDQYPQSEAAKEVQQSLPAIER